MHIGSGLFALLLRVLNGWQAAALAAAALVFNVVLLPRVGGRQLYRPVDHARGFPLGILLYPLAVLLLTLAFPSRLDIAAAAWGILAFGDGFATLIGRSRTEGTAETAYDAEENVLCELRGLGGSIRSYSLEPRQVDRRDARVRRVRQRRRGRARVVGAAGDRPMPPLAFTLAAPLAAARARGAGRDDPGPARRQHLGAGDGRGRAVDREPDDDAGAGRRARRRWSARCRGRSRVNALTGWLGYRARTVSRSGAIAGVLVGALIYVGGGAGAWVLLLATFIVASVTSRLGLARKEQLGIAEERGGRRGAGNAIANCGVAAVAAIAAVTTPYPAEALCALVAALTAGGSDTVASEIGKAWGRSTFLVTTLQPREAGNAGAMSVEGTVAGLLAAIALAACGAALGLIPFSAVLLVVAAATAGALVESALGATLEGPGILNNDMLNFINTAVAAAVALALL